MIKLMMKQFLLAFLFIFGVVCLIVAVFMFLHRGVDVTPSFIVAPDPKTIILEV